MSTLPGQASKGEKTKPKFQSLDINSLYRVSRGENPEKQQQKSSLTYIKHGMQSLGKVPSARRPPANLPSLKAEHGGSVNTGSGTGNNSNVTSDSGSTSSRTAVPLVPAGAPPGWGKQESGQVAQAPKGQNQQSGSHQPNMALSVSASITHKQLTSGVQNVPGGGDKLWSSVMGGQETSQPPLYQSAQFQHEFPSLSAGEGGSTRTSDAPPYPAGLSLRPQTEGTWAQGGQRGANTSGLTNAENGPLGQRGPVPPGGPPQLPAQVGLQQAGQQPFPPPMRGMMPSFMVKNNSFQPPPPSNSMSLQRNSGGSHPLQSSGRPAINGRPDGERSLLLPRFTDREASDEILAPRPIIKEEELNRMDELGREVGWAESDEIDYNQKLAFSDDEADLKPATSKKEQMSSRRLSHQQQQQPQSTTPRDHRDDVTSSDNVAVQRQWNGSTTRPMSRGRSSTDEEELWVQQRRNETGKEVELAVQRAKQRKEEEEKRFNEERKQGAAKKLMELEEKIQKRDRDNNEVTGAVNPAMTPPKADLSSLSDFHKEKDRERDGIREREREALRERDRERDGLRDRDGLRERDNRSRTPNDTVEDKIQVSANNFRHLAQMDAKNFPRKHPKAMERDRDREQFAPNFSRHFQSDLPPRFLRHQRNNSSSNLQNPPYHQFDNRWSLNNQTVSKPQNISHNVLHGSKSQRLDSPDVEKERVENDDRRDYKRQSSEDSFRSSHHSQQDLQKAIESAPRYSSENVSAFESQYTRRDQKNKEKESQSVRAASEDWGGDRREKGKDDKPIMESNSSSSSLSTWYDSRDRERPQRPDSRDSRSTRHSRDSEPRDYGTTSWATDESIRHSRDSEPREYGAIPWTDEPPVSHSRVSEQREYGTPSWTTDETNRHSRESEQREYGSASWTDEPAYEEKRREEKRPAVPGPITKDRVEAEERNGEKRTSLTQLKRGQTCLAPTISEKKEEKKEGSAEEKKSPVGGNGTAWADSIPPAIQETEKKFNGEEKVQEQHKSEPKQPELSKKSEEYSQNRNNRSYPQKKGWGNSTNDYHMPRNQGWQKRSTSRGHKIRDYHITDSDGSAEDHAVEHKAEIKNDSHKFESRDQKSPKPVRKLDKEEKNRENKQEKISNEYKKQERSEKRENYVPRGEPSRHGRGGSSFRSGGRGCVGGLGGKRIDGYGPPPSKSPFGGHHEDSTNKKFEESSATVSLPTTTSSSDSANLSSSQTQVSQQSTIEDKTKQNQQALAAGIIGKRAMVAEQDQEKTGRGRIRPDMRKSRPKGSGIREEGGGGETIIETFDEKNKDKDIRKMQGKYQGIRQSPNVNRSRNNPPRLGDKRIYDNPRQNSNFSFKKDDKLPDQIVLTNAIVDISIKNKEEAERDEKEDKTSINGDAEGFQEVKSKKTVKERQKSEDKSKNGSKDSKDASNDRERKNKMSQLTQQQIQNIPPLMAAPVPPPVLLQSKTQFDRSRQSKLPPRFAKQKLQKAQMQHHNICDANDMNKINQNMSNVYGIKDTTASASVNTCAWDKPLSSQLRNIEHDGMLGVAIDKGLETNQPSSQGASPNNEKLLGNNKPGQLQDKTLLDGSTPPVNTIIFENTNFKSAPGSRNNRNEKPRVKLEDGNVDTSSVMSTFSKQTMNELLQNKNDSKSDGIPLPLFKEDSADMKLDFFDSDIQFTTDDKGAKNLCMTKTIHAISSGNNTVDSLDIKIASVKKVWETSEQEGEDSQISFGGPPLDSNVFSQGKDTSDDNHEGYSPSPNQSSTTTNVCKVKPTQQVSGSGQTVLSTSSHQQHSGIVAPGLMGNPLSPPPMPPVLGANVGIGPQQYTANQHLGYQASLSGNTQYGISAIPSPPTVPLVYSQTQQLQAAAAQTASLYGAFQIDQTGVLGGQGRSQFSQYPNYHAAPHHHHHGGLGQTPAGGSHYSAQSVYLQTAPPPHASAAAQGPPPELYAASGVGGYRLSAAAAAAAAQPFGQSQPLNNPTTVLISSTSNSLMSASVKASSQPISAIGTKAGGVGQAYQQQSQQGQQVYMTYDPSTIQAAAANYLAAAAAPSAIQRGPPTGPPPPVQNSVPALQPPSSSFYSGSTGTGGQTGYFQQPGSSTIPSAQLQQHQAGYGLQGNVFGTHNQSHTNTGLQNYNFLTTPMQVAAALNAQQFRSGLPAAYMKTVGSQQIGDQSTRPQQLKSPSSQEVLSSVFNTGPQIPSPKSRQNCKHPPPQSSPTAQQKYNLYQGVGSQQSANIQRYPTPIQRPINFQQMQQNSINQKHRNNPNNKAPNRQYYGGQNNSLSVQNEKSNDSKINDNVGLSNTNSSSVAKTTIGSNSSVTTVADKVKDNIKEETATLKD